MTTDIRISAWAERLAAAAPTLHHNPGLER